MKIATFITKRNLLIAAGAIFAAMIIITTTMRTSHSGEIGLTVVVQPDDSTFTVDGEGARAGKVYVTKGKHTLVASKTGFKDAKVEIDTATIDLSRTIYLMPSPDSEEAISWLATHPEIQEKREAAAGAEALDFQKDLEKTPLIQQLPFTAPGFEFIVDYTTQKAADGKLKAIIIIKASTDEAKQNARNWIEQQGVKVSSLTIEYQANTTFDSFDNPNVGHQ